MRTISRPLACLSILAAIIFILAPLANADIPKVISYQGKVTDAGGTPVPDGTYDMRFSIWSSESGGFYPLWQSGIHNVQVTDGIFSVLLGTIGDTLDLQFKIDLWLEVIVDGDIQIPRQRLGSVGYAYMVSGLVAGTEVSGTVDTGTNAAIAASNTATVGFGLYAEGHDCGVRGYTSATSGTTYGGCFESSSTGGRGVYSTATATSGSTYGIYGSSFSTDGTGVYGNGDKRGVYGESSSTSGLGVFGYAYATSGTTYGVYGRNSSNAGHGVYGHAHRISGTTYGVYGETWSPDGYGVYYAGGLAGTGTKSCVVKTSQGPTLMYCQESPENWFEDFGEGQLVNGRCHVELDPLFLETVTIDAQNPMKVFVQLIGDCKGVYVIKGSSAFDVVELQGGGSSTAFDYRVMAKRKGFESKRLDYCKAAETDSYLYPELREKELRELEHERARFEEERRRHEEFRAARALENEPIAETILRQ